jgi:hypothetical protein
MRRDARGLAGKADDQQSRLGGFEAARDNPKAP